MAELATTHTRSLVATALDEHTDLDALLGAILADSASVLPSDDVLTSPTEDSRPVSTYTSARVVATAVASTPATTTNDALAHVTVTVSERPAPRAQVGESSRTTRERQHERAVLLTPEDLDRSLRDVELEPTIEPRPEPRLDEIDAFLDARIGRMTTPGWSTFAPEPRSQNAALDNANVVSGGLLTGATRRMAAVAAALGLGVLVVWTVLR
ncbi:MAG: hypothetical protein U0Q11_11465 [Vicinamibacterales bacterium]